MIELYWHIKVCNSRMNLRGATEFSHKTVSPELVLKSPIAILTDAR